MSSVQDTIQCPQCGGCYTTDFDCRTFEEFKFCHRCGKREEIKMVRDEKGAPILDENNNPKYIEGSHFGYGCLKLAGKQGVSALYSLSGPLTEESFNSIKESFDNEDIDIGESYLTRWDEEKNDVIAVFGSLPPRYDEIPEDEEDENG